MLISILSLLSVHLFFPLLIECLPTIDTVRGKTILRLSPLIEEVSGPVAVTFGAVLGAGHIA